MSEPGSTIITSQYQASHAATRTGARAVPKCRLRVGRPGVALYAASVPRALYRVSSQTVLAHYRAAHTARVGRHQSVPGIAYYERTERYQRLKGGTGQYVWGCTNQYQTLAYWERRYFGRYLDFLSERERVDKVEEEEHVVWVGCGPRSKRERSDLLKA
eukprot:3132782-Rhodomonas_salina.1